MHAIEGYIKYRYRLLTILHIIARKIDSSCVAFIRVQLRTGISNLILWPIYFQQHITSCGFELLSVTDIILLDTPYKHIRVDTCIYAFTDKICDVRRNGRNSNIFEWFLLYIYSRIRRVMRRPEKAVAKVLDGNGWCETCCNAIDGHLEYRFDDYHQKQRMAFWLTECVPYIQDP